MKTLNLQKSFKSTDQLGNPCLEVVKFGQVLKFSFCTEGGGGGYGGSRGGGGDRSRGDSSDLVTQEDTIFVSGMPDNVTEDDVKAHFGSIGVIKVRERKRERKTPPNKVCGVC